MHATPPSRASGRMNVCRQRRFHGKRRLEARILEANSLSVLLDMNPIEFLSFEKISSAIVSTHPVEEGARAQFDRADIVDEKD
jgi:hypothetical protein